jgi:hypothetical protein
LIIVQLLLLWWRLLWWWLLLWWLWRLWRQKRVLRLLLMRMLWWLLLLLMVRLSMSIDLLAIIKCSSQPAGAGLFQFMTVSACC